LSSAIIKEREHSAIIITNHHLCVVTPHRAQLFTLCTLFGYPNLAGVDFMATLCDSVITVKEGAVALPFPTEPIIIRRDQMFAINRYLTAADVAFSSLEVISKFDYVSVGNKVITATATICAVIVAVVSYIVTALQLFWLERGDTIIINTIRFTVTLADFTGNCYQAGRKVRPQVNLAVNHLADTAFFKLAALV
jgi:hypothetical protein